MIERWRGWLEGLMSRMSEKGFSEQRIVPVVINKPSDEGFLLSAI